MGTDTTVPQQTAAAVYCWAWLAYLTPACSPAQGTPCPWLAASPGPAQLQRAQSALPLRCMFSAALQSRSCRALPLSLADWVGSAACSALFAGTHQCQHARPSVPALSPLLNFLRATEDASFDKQTSFNKEQHANSLCKTARPYALLRARPSMPPPVLCSPMQPLPELGQPVIDPLVALL
ncbi:hypothetical protein HaLaN_03461, partial [Haematococcus lacustris]